MLITTALVCTTGVPVLATGGLEVAKLSVYWLKNSCCDRSLSMVYPGRLTIR